MSRRHCRGLEVDRIDRGVTGPGVATTASTATEAVTIVGVLTPAPLTPIGTTRLSGLLLRIQPHDGDSVAVAPARDRSDGARPSRA